MVTWAYIKELHRQSVVETDRAKAAQARSLAEQCAEYKYEEPPIQRAIDNGNLEEVRRLLDEGHDPDDVGFLGLGNCYGTSLLAAMALLDDPSHIVRLLLSRGANPNVTHGLYHTPLQEAAKLGDRELIQILLDHGADINNPGGRNGSVVEAAVTDLKLVQWLIEKGADPTLHNKTNGGTALHAACLNGDVEAIRFLVACGANPHVRGGAHDNMLQAAVASGNVECVNLILEMGVPIDLYGGEYHSIAQAAAVADTPGLLRQMLDLGADPNAHDSSSTYGCALTAAAWNGNLDDMQLLLSQGVDVNAAGSYGTALHVAVYRGEVDCVNLLLQHGADVDALGGEDGNTPLCIAAGGTTLKWWHCF
jgi:ankyrin repeat protein